MGVSIQTNYGTYAANTDGDGCYNAGVRIFICPVGDVMVSASYLGISGLVSAAPSGSPQRVDIDLTPGADPCDCADQGYQSPCTYWLLPHCDMTAPPGYGGATATPTPTTTKAATATTQATETATTTTYAATTAATASEGTTTAATTTTAAGGTGDAAAVWLVLLLLLLLLVVVLALMLRRRR